MGKPTGAKASRLAHLHSLVADAFIEALQPQVNPETKQPVPPSPALLTSAAKFLRDNGVECDPEETPQMEKLRRAVSGDKVLYPFDPAAE